LYAVRRFVVYELMNRLFVGVKQAEGEVEPGMEDGLLAGQGKQFPSGPTADAFHVPFLHTDSCPSKREQVIGMGRDLQAWPRSKEAWHDQVEDVLRKGKEDVVLPEVANALCRDPQTEPTLQAPS
jgi:hypothetical protein